MHFSTVISPGESLYREKGSRFIGWALPVKSEEEAKDLLNGLRAQHPDAVHVCYAYLLQKDKGEGRSSDDGEPSGTAGKPILNQILSSRLEDVLVAVIRYYGGIKLGTGGLIQAYKTSAKDALAAAETSRIEMQETLRVVFPFSLEGKINSLIKKYRMEVGDRAFAEGCRFTLHIPLSLFAEAKAELEALHGVDVSQEIEG